MRPNRICLRRSAWCCTAAPPSRNATASAATTGPRRGSPKNHATTGASASAAMPIARPSAALSQKSAVTSVWVTFSRWTVATERPRSLKRPRNPVTTTAIPKMP
jgi:hypothetical protein